MAEDDLQERVSQLEQDLSLSRANEKELEGLLEKKLNELYIHYHLSQIVGSLLDLREMLDRASELIHKSFPFERMSLYLFDEKRELLELVFSRGFSPPGKVSLRIGEGTPGRIAETGEHVHLHDLSLFYETFNDFIHYPREEKRDGSYIGIALKAQNTTLGVIGLDHASRNGLTVDDLDFLSILSHQLAAGIEKSLLFKTIQRLSQHDGLTGLYNRRVFQDRLQQEIGRRNRTRTPLSLMMFDIDHFKRFNDNYGHQAGDAVLRELSQIVMIQTRSSSVDTCCRYGGEEFAVIMAETEPSNAFKVAERLRKAVADHVFLAEDRKLEHEVTISLGIAGITGTETLGPEELVKQADNALYQSKRNGRNQVSYNPPEKE